MKKYFYDFNSIIGDAFDALNDDDRCCFCADYLKLMPIVDKLKGYSYRLCVDIFTNPDVVTDALSSCLIYFNGDVYNGYFDVTFDEFCRLYYCYRDNMSSDILSEVLIKFGLNSSDVDVMCNFFDNYV